MASNISGGEKGKIFRQLFFAFAFQFRSRRVGLPEDRKFGKRSAGERSLQGGKKWPGNGPLAKKKPRLWGGALVFNSLRMKVVGRAGFEPA